MPRFDTAVLIDPRQDLRALDPDRLQRVRIEPEQAQNGRRDLSRLDPPVRRMGSDGAGGVGEQRHVAVTRPSAAALVLQRAARVAESAGGPRQLRPGEYWYVKSVWTTPGVQLAEPSGRGSDTIVNALSTYERQAWIGLGRPGRVESHVVGPITFLSAAARRQWIRAGRPRELPGYNGSLSANAFLLPYRQLLSLPTNVDVLWQRLYREAGGGSAAWRRHEMFTEIGDLLREDPIPAKVRAALYRVAARIPGIQMLGLTHDGIGRPALAVALNDALDGMRSELLFDPKTSRLLGERSVVVKPPPAYHVKPGTVREGATYITSGIVERIGQVPGRWGRLLVGPGGELVDQRGQPHHQVWSELLLGLGQRGVEGALATP